MAATGTPTPNIGLRRPQGTDPASVDDINYNSNLIDTKLGAVGNTSVQEQINSLNSNINTTNYSSDITTGTGENDAFCRCLKTGNVVQLTFQGNSRTHTENEILCTVPSALRPNYTTYHIGTINGKSCVVQMSSGGDAKLYALYGNTDNARVYFNATYVIGG